MNIAVVGTGYVGLVAGACFADNGHEVICVDIDVAKIEGLKNGLIPIYEPGLEDVVKRNVKNGALHFTTALEEAVEKSEVIFIAVGTPQDEDGSADLRHVLAVARGIGRAMKTPKVIVDKSTVPVGTADKVAAAIREETDVDFDVVSNPEFLKEGAAIEDFMKPDRVVIGVPNERSEAILKELYAPFVRTNNPIIVMDVASAEMTKYAANAMLATRISFMNEISRLCDTVGADVDSVRIGMGTDSRIGMSFLFPGIGYGGSCFPKDVQALVRTAAEHGVDFKIASAVEAANYEQKKVLVEKILAHFGGPKGMEGKTFALWGLAFKPKTDDTREAPALVIAEALQSMGANLRLFDPEANKTFAERFGERSRTEYFLDNYQALEGADALVLCTEWNSFRRPNYVKLKSLLKKPLVFDGRNIFDPKQMKKEGFTYYSIGRPPVNVA